jgi:uncharacterized protein (DUF111 family)
MRFLFDPSESGVSGDMILACLYAAGADPRVVGEKLSPISRVSVKQSGGRVNRLEISIKPDVHSDSFEVMRRLLDEIDLGRTERGFATKVLDTLDEAEGKAHGGAHRLEELGSLDTLVDVVGTACAANELGMFESEVISLPVAIGIPQGAHQGLAVNVMLEGVPNIKKNVEHELTTPTGLAVLSNLAEFKEGASHKSGTIYYSAGTAELIEPHILKLIVSDG